MRACVIVFPGTNAETEMVRTLEKACGVQTETLWHTATTLPPVDLVVLPGGFSYGDYLRSGALAKGSPILPALRQHAARGGYVLGVCNGFQILTEIGLLPGALLRNRHRRFVSKLCFVQAPPGVFGASTPAPFCLPIAHADGRYHASPEQLAHLQGENAIALRYCTREGNLTDEANPNGSLDAIAGLYGGPRRNILGLMPHPERRSEPLHGGIDGRTFLKIAFGLSLV